MLNLVRIGPVSLDREYMLELRQEAAQEGCKFVDRMFDDWAQGINRFDQPGEILVAAQFKDRVIGVGGLNREPYEPSDQLGRLRHLYVVPDYRRTGVATMVVNGLLEHGASSFAQVRLRTSGPEAAAFYEALGFQKLVASTATHVIEVRPNAPA